MFLNEEENRNGELKNRKRETRDREDSNFLEISKQKQGPRDGISGKPFNHSGLLDGKFNSGVIEMKLRPARGDARNEPEQFDEFPASKLNLRRPRYGMKLRKELFPIKALR